MSIGNKILSLRKNLNYSQEKLAEKMSVTRQTISKWELDETSPDIKQAKLLSKLFNVSLDELVNNDIQNLLIEKVSNTERLAGMIITILKFFMGFIIGFFIVLIVGSLLFIIIRTKNTENVKLETTIYCSNEENKYVIKVDNYGYFDCNNCNEEMRLNLQDKIDFSNTQDSVNNISKYFADMGGTCE